MNLTTPQAHYEVTKQTLLAGKHSYCEKPLSIEFEQGKEIVNLAKEKNLYLGNAPDTFLGAAGQKARQIIDENKLSKNNVKKIYDYVLNGMHYGKPKSVHNKYYKDPWLNADGKYGMKAVNREEVVKLYQKAKKRKW